MSLLYNVLSRLVIAFLPRSKHLVSFMAAVTVVILEPKKICQSFFFPICHGFPAAAAAKSLQPTRLPRPWDSPGKNTGEWVAISFSNAWKWKWSRSVLTQRPHGLQPTRLLGPWDFPGKSTGVGCHCLSDGFHEKQTNQNSSSGCLISDFCEATRLK